MKPKQPLVEPTQNPMEPSLTSKLHALESAHNDLLRQLREEQESSSQLEMRIEALEQRVGK